MNRLPRLSLVARTGWCWLLLTAPGCSLLTRPEMTFHSNQDLLESFARAIDFAPSAKLFRLRHVQLNVDAIGLDYVGVDYPGDSAWVWRYSAKSSEQDPDAIADPRRFIPVIEEKRASLAANEVQVEKVGGATLRFLTYTFDSPIRDSLGKAYAARGIVGTLEREIAGERVVYSFNLDNWGDRPSLGRDDLEPFLREMLK